MDKLRRQLAQIQDCLTKLESLVKDAESSDLVAAMRADLVQLNNLLEAKLRAARKL